MTQGQWAFLSAFQAWQRGAFGLGTVLGKIGVLFGDKRPAYTESEAHRAS